MAETVDAVPATPEEALERAGLVVDGRYRIGEVLARGGMGIVYAAQHVTLHTRLAIKVLRPELGRDDDMVARFQREARAASALGHPHIVDVRDFGTTPDGASYFVMERLDGRDLSDELRRGPLAPARAVRIALQVLDALAAAHAHGIVHRDLKPENVFLVDRGHGDHVKVLDFGVAKVLDADDGRSGETVLDTRATSGRILGTPTYMSPEQCAGAAVDGRSDLYALGIVLYELVTGTTPFEHEDPYAMMRLHAEAAPMPPSELVPGIPGALERAILRCLAKSPDARPASAAALAAELALLAPADVSPPRGFSRPSAGAPREAGPRERERIPKTVRWPLAVTAVVVAIGLGAIAVGAVVGAEPDLRAVLTTTIASAPASAAAATPAPVPASASAPASAPATSAAPASAPATSAARAPTPASSESAAAPQRSHRPRVSAPPPAPPIAPPVPVAAPRPDSPALRPVIDPWADPLDR